MSGWWNTGRRKWSKHLRRRWRWSMAKSSFQSDLCTLNLQKMTVCMPMFKNQMIWVISAFIHTAQMSEEVMPRCFRWFRKIQTIKAHIYWFMDLLYFHCSSLSRQNISTSIGSYICFVTKIFVSHFRMTILPLGVPTVQSSCTLSWEKHTQMTLDLISL